MIRAPFAAACGLLLVSLSLRAQESPASTPVAPSSAPAAPASDAPDPPLVRSSWRMPDTVGTRRTRVTGWVVDARTGEPLPGARIGIPRLRRSAIAGRRGDFVLDRMPPGAWPAMVLHLGYQAEVMLVPVDAAGGEVTLSLTPDALVLEKLEVSFDRFKARRNAVAAHTRVLTTANLANAAGSARDVVLRRLALVEVACRSPGWGTIDVYGPCVRVRGTAVAPHVFIDERPAFGGLDELDMYDASDMAMVESYFGGTMIRAYTPQFLEWAARRNYRPHPFI